MSGYHSLAYWEADNQNEMHRINVPNENVYLGLWWNRFDAVYSVLYSVHTNKFSLLQQSRHSSHHRAINHRLVCARNNSTNHLLKRLSLCDSIGTLLMTSSHIAVRWQREKNWAIAMHTCASQRINNLYTIAFGIRTPLSFHRN